MKKIITLIITLLITLSLIGCNKQDTPSTVASAYIESLQKEGAKQIVEKALDGSLENFQDNEELFTKFGTMLLDFDYDAVNERILDNNNATVDIEFKTYDYVELFKNFLTDYIGQALSMAIAGKTEEDLEKFAIDLMKEKLDETKENGKTRITNITIELEKVEDKWAVKKSSNNNISNALLGDLKDSLEELSHQLLN